MNKKALWLIFAFLVFWGTKKDVFADVSYDLVEKKIYLAINAKNIATAEFSCDNGSFSKTFTNDNPVMFGATMDLNILSQGGHYCKLTYVLEKSTKVNTNAKKTYIYVREPLNDTSGTCVSTNESNAFDGMSEEENCKKNGCKWNGDCVPYKLSGTSSSSSTNSNGSTSSFGNSSNFGSSSSGTSGSSNSTNLDRNDNEPFDASTFCYDIKAGLRIVGITIVMIKIVIPLAIVLMGSFDFYKTVSSGKSDDLKKDAIMVGKRVLTGLIIFFLPTIIKTTIDFLDSDMEADYHYCINCLFDPLNTCDD